MKYQVPFFFVTIVLHSVFFSCASQPKATNPLKEQGVIASKLGNNITTEENTDKTHLLLKQKPEGENVARVYKYIVVRKSDNQIVLEGTYQLGYVKWINDSQIEVLSLPSVTEQDESKYKKVLSVLSQKL